MTSLIEHLENHLGPIEAGWSQSADGDPMPFQVVKFRGQGSGGPVPYATLGLSKYALTSSVSGKKIRQELMLLTPADFGDRNIPAIMQTIGAEALGLEKAYLRGEIIGPRGQVFYGLPFTALYVSMPVYYPESLHTFIDDRGNAIVIAWLVPITESEERFVREHGWERFEDLLEQRGTDLVDMNRSAFV